MQKTLKLAPFQSVINQLQKKIIELRKVAQNRYEVLKKRDQSQINLESWIDMRANLKIDSKISEEIGNLTKTQSALHDELKALKSNEDVASLRFERSAEFRGIFNEVLRDMSVNLVNEKRYKDIYHISSFPSQGVELHKTVMAYHFAFNRVLSKSGVHRLPLLLDAIFKEDIEPQSKAVILKCLNMWLLSTEQAFVTIADSSNEDVVVKYNKNFFSNRAKLICIGNAIRERAFLDEMSPENTVLFEETIRIVNEN